MRGVRGASAAALIAMSLAGEAHADTVHLYSYDPADAETRHASGPLTFMFRKGLLHTTVLNLRSTEASATAYLRPADEKALGPAGLAGAVGAEPAERALYRVEPADEGTALISAFCPGAMRAWLAFGPLKLNRDLTVRVIGAPTAGPAKLCRTLRFSFHGEWLLPPERPMDPRELERGRYPGS
ncbi:MAG: hypothetical protein JWO83_282 [Caulobacteraceae bacterium]|nr:hypothetical protein [Caulobacteraceae bacterium]